MADDHDKKCSNCGGVLLAEDKPASITQWIFLCSCGKQPVEPPQDTPNICRKCGKRIDSGKSGSITQWVFRPQTCSCSVPEEMLPAAVPERSSEQTLLEDPPEDEVALEIDPTLIDLSRYKPLELLGQGASSQVFKCRDLLLNKIVAVKSIRSQSSELALAIQNEARAIGQLKHPGVIEIFDCGVAEGGNPFIVMEYFKGRSLDEHLEQTGELESPKAILIAGKICSAMEYIHSHGIFHRDLKPANILILEQDEVIEVKIIDFSIAVRQNVEERDFAERPFLAGSPLYMSPDEPEGRPYSEQSEIYSFGCILFKMLSSVVPFHGNTSMATLTMHAKDEVPEFSTLRPDLEIPDYLEAIVRRCLEKEPQNRFQSFAELNKALAQSIPDKSIQTDSADVSPIGKNRRVLVFSVAMLLVFISVAGAYMMTQNPGKQKKSQPVVKAKQDYLKLVPKNTHKFRELNKFGHRFITGTSGTADGDIAELKDLAQNKRSINVDLSGSQVTGATLGLLSQTPVNWLILSDNNISKEGFSQLAKLKRLKGLTLERVALSDDAVSQICSLDDLRILDVQAGGLGDDHLDKLTSSLKILDDLDVSENMQLSPQGIMKIARLKRLHTLYLPDTKADFKSTTYLLNNLPNLSRLMLINCTYISKQEADLLVKNHPGCSIMYMEAGADLKDAVESLGF